MRTISLVFVLLTGCTTMPSVVKVPVVTPCKINMPERPDMSAYKVTPGDSTARKAAKLAARELALKEYALKLEAEASACR